VPSPERTLIGEIEGGVGHFTAASLAAPPGVRWGVGKLRQKERIAAWLRDRTGPVVFGMDANTPKWDRHDFADTEWWDDREAVLHGVERAHDLRDVYREHLSQNPEERARIGGERPDGPLQVSFERGRGSSKTACRYDFIYASPEFVVRSASYLYDDALTAGSDHALIIAELELT
jgi:endonuclease/exonuclease/phosphatase family metal-dependent hydrolase